MLWFWLYSALLSISLIVGVIGTILFILAKYLGWISWSWWGISIPLVILGMGYVMWWLAKELMKNIS